jgi:hypothetical protein
MGSRQTSGHGRDIIVVCPHCHKNFPLTAALGRQARDLLLGQEAERLRSQIVVTAKREAEAEYEARLREKDERIDRINRQLADVRRQTEHGSRQLEGIAAQRLFGSQLAGRFPEDQITTVRQGHWGADVIQAVRTETGWACGTILWECKRTARWDPKWLRKLEQDRTGTRADIAVLVSEKLPVGTEGVGQLANAWVCNFANVWDLAPLFRALLLGVARYRVADAARADAASRVFDYIASGEFASRLTGVGLSLKGMQETLDRERRGMLQNWAERQKQIDHSWQNLAFLVGDLVGLGATVPEAARAELAPPPEPALAAAHQP